MDDALAMRFAQRAQHLAGNAREPFARQRPFERDELAEISSVQQLHRVVPEPVVRRPVVEHANGVRMRQLGEGAHLAFEAQEAT